MIRSREANLTVTSFAYMSDNYSFTNLDFIDPFQVDRLRGVRGRVDADVADKLNGINQFSFTVSRGIEGLGSTDNGNLLASRLVGRVDYSKIRRPGQPVTAAIWAIFRLGFRLRPVRRKFAAGA